MAIELVGPEPHFLYRAFNTNGDLLYVGIASNVRRRLATHAVEKEWWSEVASVKTEMFDDRAQALKAERAAILDESPRYNIVHSTHNPPRPWVDRRAPHNTPEGKVAFTSTAIRSGRVWVLQCDQVPGALSQVTRLDQAAEHQREAIAFVAEIPETMVDVEVIPQLDPAVAETINTAIGKRREAEELAASATRQMREVARSLTDEGHSLRDVGVILGVSFQRVGQLIND